MLTACLSNSCSDCILLQQSKDDELSIQLLSSELLDDFKVRITILIQTPYPPSFGQCFITKEADWKLGHFLMSPKDSPPAMQ